MRLSKHSPPRSRWTAALAPIAVCTYIIGFTLPFQWDIPLIALAVMSVIAFASGSRKSRSSWPPLTMPVAIFLAATGMSTLASEDIGRSLRLSTPLLPTNRPVDFSLPPIHGIIRTDK